MRTKDQIVPNENRGNLKINSLPSQDMTTEQRLLLAYTYLNVELTNLNMWQSHKHQHFFYIQIEFPFPKFVFVLRDIGLRASLCASQLIPSLVRSKTGHPCQDYRIQEIILLRSNPRIKPGQSCGEHQPDYKADQPPGYFPTCLCNDSKKGPSMS